MATCFECTLCLDNFTDPLLLPCSHTYCRDCLKHYLTVSKLTDCCGTKFNCPLCRTEIVLPNKGVNGLQKNFYLSESSGQHSKSNYQFCKDHPGEDLRFYCQTCDAVICRDCKVVSHEGHKTDMVINVINELKQKVETILNEAEKEIKSKHKELRGKIEQEIEHIEEKLVNGPQRIVENLKDEIQSVIKVIAGVTKPYRDQRKDGLGVIEEWAKLSNQRISACKTTLSQVLNCTSEVKIEVLKELAENEVGINEFKKSPSFPMEEPNGYLDEKHIESILLRLSEAIIQATNEFKEGLTGNSYNDSATTLKDERVICFGVEQSESPDNETMRQDFESVPDTWDEHLENTEYANGWERDDKSYSWASVVRGNLHVKQKIPARPVQTELTSLGTISGKKQKKTTRDTTSDNFRSTPWQQWHPLREKSEIFQSVRFDNAPDENNHAVTPAQNNAVYSDDQQLFVGNLFRTVPEWKIKECFEKFGTVVDVRLVNTGRYKNYGFVVFDSSKTVREILQRNPVIKLHGHQLDIKMKRQNRHR